MAESGDKQRQEIEAESSAPDTAAKQQHSGGFRFWKKKSPGGSSQEKPSDAVKLGCGGLFRRKKKQPQEDNGKSCEPTEKSSKNKSIKEGIVKAEEEAASPNGQPATTAAAAAAAEDAATKVEAQQNTTDGVVGPPPPIDSLPSGSTSSLLDSATVNEPEQQQHSSESADKSKPPARPANPPPRPRTPLAELARKAEERATVEDSEQKTLDQETAADVERKAAEKADAERKAADKADAERKAADKADAESKAVETAAEEEEEKERQRKVEQQFEQNAVDISKVAAKPGVKIEQNPHSEMWSTIVNKSFVGTGTFVKAAVCSLESGAVLACNPADFTPTVEQVAALRDNFDNRSAFSAAGFGVADIVYQLQEETATEDILCGADSNQAVLVTKTNTALIAVVCTKQVDRAVDMLGEMREHFISQGV